MPINETVQNLINVFRTPTDRSYSSDIALVKAYNKSRTNDNHKSFCYAPSSNMYFAQDGRVKVCCNNFHYVIGRYPEQTIKEIWNSKAAVEMRNRMKQYDLSAGCRVCELDFKSSNFNEVRARHFDTLPVNAHYPTMMEFLLTNICNLECVMCRGENSSLIRKNREKLPPIPNAYSGNFVEQLEEFIPHLHETRFSGSGEAFAIDINYSIWEMILNKNPRCLIMIQTNGTFLNSRIKELLNLGNFEIGVSLDSLQKEQFESIRVNARFETVKENILYFAKYSKERNKKFTISTCVMRQNWEEIPNFITFCNSIDASINLHKVWAPREMALFNLPAHELGKICDYWEDFSFPEETPLQKQNKEHFKYFISVVRQWMEQAPQLQADLLAIKGMDKNELNNFVCKKVEDHINSSSATEAEKRNNIAVCKQKIVDVLGLCPDNISEEDMLEWMAQLTSEELTGGVLWETVDFILHEAARIITPKV